MRVKLKILIVFLSMVLLGCSSINIKNDTEQDMEQNMEYELTERQIQILYTCGFSLDEIADMKENGMPKLTRNFVENAEEVLILLENKYGKKFKVIGGQTPSTLSSDYEYYLREIDDEKMWEEFVVSIVPNKDKTEWQYWEGYYGIVVSEQLADEIQNYVEDYEVKALVISECQVELEHDTKDKLAYKEDIAYIRCYVEKRISEDVFETLSKEIESKLRDDGYWISFSMYRVTDDEILDSLTTYSDIRNKYDGNLFEQGLCDLYYHDGVVYKRGD